MDRLDFSDRLRQVLAEARREAARRRHDHVGSEHLLLALLDEVRAGAPLPMALRALDTLRVDRAALRRALESGALAERAVLVAARALDEQQIPYTSRARDAITAAGAEARMLRGDSVEPEHLLLGLLHDAGGAASALFAALGVTVEDARSALVRQRR